MLSPPGACITLSLPDDADTISSINFNPIGDALCASGWDGKVYVWNWDSKAHKATIDFDYPVLDTAWKDNATLLAAGCDGILFQIDPETGVKTIVGRHDDAIQAVRWLPVRHLAVTGSSDEFLKLWDLRSGDKPVSSVKLEGRVWAMDHADDTLVTATSNGRISIHKLTDPTTPFRMLDNPIQTPTVTVSVYRNGSGYVVGSVEGRCAVRFTEDDADKSKSYIFKCQRKQGPLGNEAYSVNVVEFHPTKPHVFVVAGGSGSFTFFEKDAKLRLKDHDYGDGDYATRRVRDSITAGSWCATGDSFVYARGYDWSLGHESWEKRHPTRIYVHTVMHSDINKN